MKRSAPIEINQAALILLFLSASLLLAGCSSEVKAEPPKAAPMAVNVVGFKTVQKDVSDTISLVGTLQANESVSVTSEISGIIEKINFQEGQQVKEGDLLFQIDKKKLEAAFDQAKANLQLAETTAQRYETLVQSKAVSQQEYEQAMATLESSRAAMELAKEQLDDATISAPFSGVVGERKVSIGQFVSQGTQLSYLYSQDPIKAEFHVPERYLGEIKIGQTVEMKVAAYKSNSYQGKVYFIDPKIDEITRTALVKAFVDNPKGELREGMFANVNLIVDVRPDSLVVPETALIIKGDDVFVYVVKDEDQTVDIRSVKEGKRFDGMVVIEQGLKKDEVVVTEGYQKLGPGSKVTVRFEDQSEKNIYEII